MSNPNLWKHGFKKGQSGNPGGRKKGVKDKIGRIKEAFCDAFDPKEFTQWANSHKSEFYPLIVKLMPKELEIGVGEGNKITILLSANGNKT